jgi:hypothetical protein
MLTDDLIALIDTYVGAGFARRLIDSCDRDNTIDTIQYSTWVETLQDPEFIGHFIFILDAMDYFMANFIQYTSAGVVDILKCKVADTTEIQRTRALWDFLISHPILACADGIPIIEHQPNKIGSKTNNKSTAVSHQLAFYYIEQDPIFIDPKLKNNITLCSKYSDVLAAELPKHKSARDARYAARKKHSRENFLYLLEKFSLLHIIETISPTVLDDLADSTMQIFAYLIENKMFYCK